MLTLDFPQEQLLIDLVISSNDGVTPKFFEFHPDNVLELWKK
ncbi:MAG: hypothetical protein AAF399_03480 [Bacteroidota bacterium]